jgi:hypothetical protein
MHVCYECGKEFESSKGAAFRITGWEQERKEGGTNHVLWRERTGEVMCPSCVTARKYGGSAQQEALAL